MYSATNKTKKNFTAKRTYRTKGLYVFLLMLFITGVVTQGCVVVDKSHPPKIVHTETTHYVEPAPQYSEPHYSEPNPNHSDSYYVEPAPQHSGSYYREDSYNHEPPAHAQSHHVAQERPFYKDKHFRKNGHSSSHQPKVTNRPQPRPQEAKLHYDFDRKQKKIILNFYTQGGGTRKFDQIQRKVKSKTFLKKIKKNRDNLLLVEGDTYPGGRTPIPNQLAKQLPRVPRHIKRFIYGTQILLVDWKTRRVLDAVNLPVEM